MSKENVELVRAVQPGPDVDIAGLVRDESAFRAAVTAFEALTHEDFEVVMVAKTLVKRRLSGAEGLREGWLDWLEPWESYRTEIEDAIDHGDDIVVLVRDFGRRRGTDAELTVSGAAIWTVRSGKIARVAFYVDRQEALVAAGLV